MASNNLLTDVKDFLRDELVPALTRMHVAHPAAPEGSGESVASNEHGALIDRAQNLAAQVQKHEDAEAKASEKSGK